MSRPKRSEAEQQWRRDRIIAAGAAVFVRSGIDGTTVEEIAREADYSPAALYNYFKNKDEILHAVFASMVQRLLSVMREPLPDGLSFIDQLRWRARRNFAVAEEHRELLVAFTTHVMADGPGPCVAAGNEKHAFMNEAMAVWEGMIAHGQAEGVLRPDLHPRMLALAFNGLARSFIASWITGSEARPLADLADALVDLFLYGASKK